MDMETKRIHDHHAGMPMVQHFDQVAWTHLVCKRVVP